MCGRYVSPDTAAIERQWHIGRTNSNPFRRRYNVSPTSNVPILRGSSNRKSDSINGGLRTSYNAYVNGASGCPASSQATTAPILL